MVTASEAILSQNHVWSFASDMRDGLPVNYTTPSINVGSLGFQKGEEALVFDLFFPAATNVNAGTPGVGVYSGAVLTGIFQHARGNPATEANWRDVGVMKRMRVHVPSGSTGAGTIANPVFSNRYRFALQTDRSQVRFSLQALGSFHDLSMVRVAAVSGLRRQSEMDSAGVN